MNSVAPDNNARWSSNAVRTIITTIKNEGPFLLEWLVYHRLIGFNRFIVYSNDCSDGTHEMLQLLDRSGIIHHFDNSRISPDLPEDPQRRAYARALTLPEVQSSDWIAVLDGDEFFQINVGNGHLDDLFAALPARTDAVGAQWRIFGNGGVIEFHDDLQIRQFTEASPKDIAFSNNQFSIKTLFRPLPVHRLGVHRPVFKGSFGNPANPVLFVNGSGQDITAAFLRQRWGTNPEMAGYDLCQVNHYMIRASDVFLMKRWRGTANSADAERINFDYYDRYNLNVVSETGITRWSDRVDQARDELLGFVPGLKQLHQNAVNAYREQIEILKAQLRTEAPEQYNRLFDPAVLHTETQQRRAALIQRRRRRAASAPTTPEVEPAPETLPSAIFLTPLLSDTGLPNMPLQLMTPWAEPATATVEPPAELPPPDVPPQWLVDMRRSPWRRGFYHSEAEFAALHVERERAHLFVTFDNLSQVGIDAIEREVWGYEFARKSVWSQLGIFAFRANWFRNQTLFDYLRHLRDAGLFERYATVTFSGTSMGAYAACAFSSLVPGAQVIAFSPQSTLAADIVPWEGRFPTGRVADWSGSFADATAETATASRVFLIYDPKDHGDRAHAERFAGDNIVRLTTPFAGHKTALRLRQAEILSRVVRGLASGNLDQRGFHDLYREVRLQPWYLDALGNQLTARKRIEWLLHLAKVAQHNGRPGVANMLRQRADMASLQTYDRIGY